MLDDVKRYVLGWNLDGDALGAIEEVDFRFQVVFAILLRWLDNERTWILFLKDFWKYWFVGFLDSLLPYHNRLLVNISHRLAFVDYWLKWRQSQSSFFRFSDKSWCTYLNLNFILNEHCFV